MARLPLSILRVFLTNRITTNKTESRAINKKDDLSEIDRYSHIDFCDYPLLRCSHGAVTLREEWKPGILY
jgi:hypothetical protein